MEDNVEMRSEVKANATDKIDFKFLTNNNLKKNHVCLKDNLNFSSIRKN